MINKSNDNAIKIFCNVNKFYNNKFTNLDNFKNLDNFDYLDTFNKVSLMIINIY